LLACLLTPALSRPAGWAVNHVFDARNNSGVVRSLIMFAVLAALIGVIGYNLFIYSRKAVSLRALKICCAARHSLCVLTVMLLGLFCRGIRSASTSARAI
jgi:hypothetical protein